MGRNQSQPGADPATAPTGISGQPVAVSVRGARKSFVLPHQREGGPRRRTLRPGRYQHGELKALRGVDFDVHEGEFFGIVGRNGSGKSTLLKCVAGIYPVDEGEIAVRGKLASFIELGVGFNPELSARDNVVLNATLLGLSTEQAEARFDDIIAFAELEEFVDLKLGNYSSGMYVRLAFSVAMHVDAEVLLIDEVLAVGDAAFQQKCFREFTRIRESGMTVLFVTHDVSLVERFCTRALLLERGEIIAFGDPVVVSHEYARVNLDLPEAGGSAPGVDDADGDGAVRIVESWCAADDGEPLVRPRFVQGDPTRLAARIHCEQAIADPVVELSVYDPKHQLVFVASSMLDGVRTGSHAAGDDFVYETRFDNHLEDGYYMFVARVFHSDGQRQCDAWRTPPGFLVVGRPQSKGVVNLPHTNEIR